MNDYLWLIECIGFGLVIFVMIFGLFCIWADLGATKFALEEKLDKLADIEKAIQSSVSEREVDRVLSKY